MRGVVLPPADISASVEGVNELVDRLPVLTEIRIHYSLRIPHEVREVVERTLEKHVSKCPSAKTLEGAVRVTWTADIEEVASS